MADNNNQRHLMATAKQIGANRANALASTGPRTKAGKTTSAQNALAHGLTAKAVVLPWESAAVFETFRADLLAALAPQGALESVLAERIACAAWRLRRVVQIEALVLDDEHSDAAAWFKRFPEKDRKTTGATLVARAWAEASEKIALLNRYEAMLERSMLQALHELERLQAARQGASVPLPAAIDVNVIGELSSCARQS